MSDDKVIKFPKTSQHDIELTLEEEGEYDEIVMGVQTALICLCSGLKGNTEADWEHIMDACVNMAITAGINSGLEHEDIEALFNHLTIERVHYDA
jgi:hypothetical protein